MKLKAREYKARKRFMGLTQAGGMTIKKVRGNPKYVDVQTFAASSGVDPRAALRQHILDALDPIKAPGKVKRFSKAEIAAMNAKLTSRE